MGASRTGFSFRRCRNEWALIAGLVLFTLLHGLVGLDHNPYFSVDEGWLLQVPRNLLASGLYGTITLAGPVPFASELTTGPAVLLPATAAFAVFGDGVMPARLVSVAYSGLAVAAAYGLLRLSVDRAAAALAVFIFSLALYPYNRAALGEMGGLAWVLVGSYWWLRGTATLTRHHLIAASIAFALATLCKVSLAPVLGMALTVTWVFDRRRGTLRTLPWLVAPLATITLGNVAWLGLQVAIIGWPEFLLRFEELTSYQPQTAAWSEAQLLHNPAVLLYALPDGLLPVWAAAVLLAPWHAVKAGLRNPQYTLPLMLFAAALLFFILSIGWPRYAFWATALGVLFSGWLVQPFMHALAAIRPDTPRYRWATAVALVAAVSVGPPSVSARDTFRLTDQTAMQAGAVLAQAMGPTERLGSTEWEIDFLARRPAHHPPAYRLPTSPEVLDATFDWSWPEADWLVLGQLARAYGAEERLLRSHALWQLHTQIGEYKIYRRGGLLATGGPYWPSVARDLSRSVLSMPAAPLLPQPDPPGSDSG